jgi:hypothetical protein
MLKVILMIDCNICGQNFNSIITSSDRHPATWEFLAQGLEYQAESSGWTISGPAHHCDWCVTDVMLAGREVGEKAAQVAKKMQEVEDDNEYPF